MERIIISLIVLNLATIITTDTQNNGVKVQYIKYRSRIFVRGINHCSLCSSLSPPLTPVMSNPNPSHAKTNASTPTSTSTHQPLTAINTNHHQPLQNGGQRHFSCEPHNSYFISLYHQTTLLLRCRRLLNRARNSSCLPGFVSVYAAPPLIFANVLPRTCR